MTTSVGRHVHDKLLFLIGMLFFLIVATGRHCSRYGRLGDRLEDLNRCHTLGLFPAKWESNPTRGHKMLPVSILCFNLLVLQLKPA